MPRFFSRRLVCYYTCRILLDRAQPRRISSDRAQPCRISSGRDVLCQLLHVHPLSLGLWRVALMRVVSNGHQTQRSHCTHKTSLTSVSACPVNEIRSNPANMCPNTIDCDPPLTLDDIDPNKTFEGLYWIHFVLMLLQALYLGMTIFIWYLPAKKEKVEEQEEEEEQVDDTPKQPPQVSPITQQLVGGLSRRKTTHRLKE